MRFGPDAGSAQRVGLVVRRLALLLRLQAVLPHRLVHRHVVGQQVVTDVELQPVPHAARVQELRRLVVVVVVVRDGRREGKREEGGGEWQVDSPEVR